MPMFILVSKDQGNLATSFFFVLYNKVTGAALMPEILHNNTYIMALSLYNSHWLVQDDIVNVIIQFLISELIMILNFRLFQTWFQSPKTPRTAMLLSPERQTNAYRNFNIFNLKILIIMNAQVNCFLKFLYFFFLFVSYVLTMTITIMRRARKRSLTPNEGSQTSTISLFKQWFW